MNTPKKTIEEVQKAFIDTETFLNKNLYWNWFAMYLSDKYHIHPSILSRFKKNGVMWIDKVMILDTFFKINTFWEIGKKLLDYKYKKRCKK